jgi:hypothetical protein
VKVLALILVILLEVSRYFPQILGGNSRIMPKIKP